MEASETKCNHPHITGYTFESDGQPAPLWACVKCHERFVPVVELIKAEQRIAELEAALVSVLGQSWNGPLPDYIRGKASAALRREG